MNPICALALLSCSALLAQSLEVSPDRVLLDQTAAIRASGLQPGERIAIRSELTDGAGARWTAQADFVADAQGTVDAARQAPAASRSGTAERRISVAAQGPEIAAAHLEQDSFAEGVRHVPVHEGSLRGILFLPAGGERHRAVLVVGGSNGGVPTRTAARLAARPEVSGGRLAVMGTSRGGELALQLGSMFPAIGAVVACVPANVRYAACCGNLLHFLLAADERR